MQSVSRITISSVRIGLVHELIFIVVNVIETLLSLLRIENGSGHVPDRDGIEIDQRTRIFEGLYEKTDFAMGVLGVADPIDELVVDKDQEG